MTTQLQELLVHQAAIARRITELRSTARADAIAAVQAMMVRHGVTLADLAGAAPAAARGLAPRATSRAKVAPKFRHPASGAAWSGRGLKPRWLAQELANGRTAADFAI